MPRRRVQFSPANYYHIFNQGNAKHDIFYNDRDMYRFLQAAYLSNNANNALRIKDIETKRAGYALTDIKKILNDHKIEIDPLVKICADSLMPNHFHFILEEIKEGGVSEFMHKLCTSYAKYFIIKNKRPGSLFRGRFGAVHIENDEQLKYVLVYVNALNPLDLFMPNYKIEGIKDVSMAWEIIEKYNWSTHQEFMGRRESILVDKGVLGDFFPNPKTYEEFVKMILRGKESNFWPSIEKLTLG